MPDPLSDEPMATKELEGWPEWDRDVDEEEHQFWMEYRERRDEEYRAVIDSIQAPGTLKTSASIQLNELGSES